MTKLPDLNTIDEEIKFWDEHDSAEYWEELEEAEFGVDLHTNLLHPRLVILANEPEDSIRESLKLEPTTIEYVTQHNGHLIIIREVPAYYSAPAGREYILEETLNQIERLLELEQTDKVKPVDTIQVPVFDLDVTA
jgi:hypothetical protein